MASQSNAWGGARCVYTHPPALLQRFQNEGFAKWAVCKSWKTKKVDMG